MANAELIQNVKVYDEYIKKNGVDERVVNAYCQAVEYAFQENDVKYGLELCTIAKRLINQFIVDQTNGGTWDLLERYSFDMGEKNEWVDLYYSILKHEAQNRVVDSYFLYLERYRDPEERFYLPRRKHFLMHGYIKGLQDLVDDNLDILSVSMPPGIGKTTMEEFFLSGIMGWFPELCNLFSSHSGHVTRMVYDVIYNILGIGVKQGQISEYAWREIFPNVVVENTNAKEEEINLGKFKPFKTLTCRALGASQTGVTRCDGILCCDDLCSGIEMAMSRMRLDKLWMMYSTDLKTRKKKGKGGRNSKELHIATRWSVWDVIGRIRTLYADDERSRFISVPDIDPETGKSNFDFDYGVGFDVKYFEDIQKSLDEITYKCLYKNEPVEREGILFNTDVLRRYTSFPFNKNGEPLRPDGIIAVCDTKDTGKDYNCLGVFRVYGQDYYLVDVVFRNIDPLSIDDLNAQCLVRNGVQVAMFESNKEGSRTADKVQEKVLEMGGSTVIDKRYTTANKETKIIVNSPWVVAHVLFPQPESADYPNGYKPNSEMGQFMAHLCSWSQLSKNPYDDAPDMVSMLAVRENPLMGGMAKVSAVQNPFRRGK